MISFILTHTFDSRLILLGEIRSQSQLLEVKGLKWKMHQTYFIDLLCDSELIFGVL